MRSSNPNIIRQYKDPHHQGIDIWGFDGVDFWHKCDGQSRWTKSKKSHLTPQRVKMFYYLVTGYKEIDFDKLLHHRC